MMCKALDIDNAVIAGIAVSAGNRRVSKTRSFLRRRPFLELTAIEGVGGASGFVFGCLFFKILAFVRVSFAFSDTDLDFYSMVLPVQAESDEG